MGMDQLPRLSCGGNLSRYSSDGVYLYTMGDTTAKYGELRLPIFSRVDVRRRHQAGETPIVGTTIGRLVISYFGDISFPPSKTPNTRLGEKGAVWTAYSVIYLPPRASITRSFFLLLHG